MPTDITPPSEREKFNFEKLKFKTDNIKWITVSVIIVVAGLILDNRHKERSTGLQEMEAFDRYVNTVLKADNIEERWKLSEFFSVVTPTERLRGRWQMYKDLIQEDYATFVRLRREADSLQRKGTKTNSSVKRLEEIKTQLEPFEKKLFAPATSKSDNDVSMQLDNQNEVDKIMSQKIAAIRNKISGGKYYNLKECFDNARKMNDNAIADVVKV